MVEGFLYPSSLWFFKTNVCTGVCVSVRLRGAECRLVCVACVRRRGEAAAWPPVYAVRYVSYDMDAVFFPVLCVFCWPLIDRSIACRMAVV